MCSACKTCYNHAKGHAPSTTLAWRSLDQTRCRGGKVTGLAYYRLGMARPFLMLKALFFDFAIKVTLQALAFQPNRRHQSIQREKLLTLMGGRHSLGHYSSSIMLYAARSLLNALILFSYSILCSLPIQKS